MALKVMSMAEIRLEVLLEPIRIAMGETAGLVDVLDRPMIVSGSASDVVVDLACDLARSDHHLRIRGRKKPFREPATTGGFGPVEVP